MENCKQDYKSFQKQFLSISKTITDEQLELMFNNQYIIDILSIGDDLEIEQASLIDELKSGRVCIQIGKCKYNQPHIHLTKYYRSCILP